MSLFCSQDLHTYCTATMNIGRGGSTAAPLQPPCSCARHAVTGSLPKAGTLLVTLYSLFNARCCNIVECALENTILHVSIFAYFSLVPSYCRAALLAEHSSQWSKYHHFCGEMDPLVHRLRQIPQDSEEVWCM